MSLGTYLFTLFRGKIVGVDDLGNKYYTEKSGGTRRWVMYKEDVESSLIPPGWHGWLHKTTDKVPSEHDVPQREWYKEHQENKTGTPEAYFPERHLSHGVQPEESLQSYTAWKPD